ncbi:MAG TPA: hypothetical protein VD927_11270 [Chryseosolibacter sp.]|nr:hypothetical protein [Chryseosolibacter sp.]
MKNTIDDSYISLLQNELRNISFFVVKSSMANTKKIKQPKDLYKLQSETTKQIPVSTAWITKEDFAFIKSIINKN